MLLIESDLNNEISILNKKLNYLKAMQFITNNFNLDSAAMYLNINYENHSLKNEVEIKSRDLHEFIINNRDNSNIYISNDSLIANNVDSVDSVSYMIFNYYKDDDSIFYINELTVKNTLLSLFQDSILHSDSIDTLETKGTNYQNKMPNINNDIVPDFNKK